MNELTPRQQRVLNFIRDFIEETGMPPTRAEIARDLGFKSANAAEEHLIDVPIVESRAKSERERSFFCLLFAAVLDLGVEIALFRCVHGEGVGPAL